MEYIIATFSSVIFILFYIIYNLISKTVQEPKPAIVENDSLKDAMASFFN